MLTSPKKILRAVGFTTGAYILNVIVRFATSVILTRLLSPELFGTVLIINTVRIGIDLLTDVGIIQSIVSNKRGEDPIFLGTAWIIQVVRGFFLAIVAILISRIVADGFQIDPIYIVASGVVLFISGFHSVSVFLMLRRLEVGRAQLYELAMDLVSSIAVILAVLCSPTVVAVIVSYIVATSIRVIATYFLRDAWPGLHFSRADAVEIVNFGKWIFLSSVLMFASMNFDRLYLGYHLPLAVFGVFGISRTVAEMPAILFSRIGYHLVFPMISSVQSSPRDVIWQHVAPIRLKLLVAAAIALGAGTAVSDIVVLAIYDKRYAEIGWMVPLLLAGVWVTVLASLAEYKLLGLGKPSYAVAGNIGKFALLVIGLTSTVDVLPLIAVVAVVAVSDFPKYAVFLFGLRRERLSFLRHDAYATVAFIASVLVFSALRWELGFGTVLQRFP